MQSPEGLSGLLGALAFLGALEFLGALGDLQWPFTTVFWPAVLSPMQERISYISAMSHELLQYHEDTVLLNPHLHVDDP